jgi:hypothetical protein
MKKVSKNVKLKGKFEGNLGFFGDFLRRKNGCFGKKTLA